MSDLCALSHSANGTDDLPVDGRRAVASLAHEPSLRVDDLGEGMAHLAVSQLLSPATARRVAAILREDIGPAGSSVPRTDRLPFGRRAPADVRRRMRGLRPAGGV